MIQNIRNIIFDLGGVLLNIDYQKSTDAFSALGITRFDRVFTQFHQNKVAQEFEKGLIPASAFRDYVRSISDTYLSDSDIDSAWNAMLLDFPPHRYQLLEKLKASYRTFLLSNTNEIHYNAFQQIIRESFAIDSLETLFEKAYYSHQVNLRKPDAEIFNKILTENHLLPFETLFIDDSIQHIQTAEKLGIRAHHLTSDTDISHVLKHLEVL